MLRMLSPAVLCAFLAVVVAGCGGSGSNGSGSGVVRIESTQFSPKTANVTTGDRVTWTNADNVPQQIVSGTLLPTASPQVLTPVISINQNNSYSPPVFEADLGDTVQFQNNRIGAFTLDILNDADTVIASLNFVQSGQIIQFSGFPSAGFYTFQQRNNPLFSGSVTVFGRPNPDNRFQSQILNPGDTFVTQFNSPGTFPYFGQNPQDPNRSFMTGTVVVQ